MLAAFTASTTCCTVPNVPVTFVMYVLPCEPAAVTGLLADAGPNGFDAVEPGTNGVPAPHVDGSVGLNVVVGCCDDVHVDGSVGS